MDSSGLSALLAAQDNAARRGARLIVVANNHAVLRLLQLTQVDAVLTIVRTAADALAHLDRHRDAASPPPHQE